MAKILLVEDDINLREIYAARLTAEGHTIEVASDGEEALASAVEVAPELIVLDVMMPKVSGFDVLDILRTTPETKNIKIIMLTALSQESDRERGEKLGADRYLVKSQITLEDVVDTINEVLREAAENPPATAEPPATGLNQYGVDTPENVADVSDAETAKVAPKAPPVDTAAPSDNPSHDALEQPRPDSGN